MKSDTPTVDNKQSPNFIVIHTRPPLSSSAKKGGPPVPASDRAFDLAGFQGHLQRLQTTHKNPDTVPLQAMDIPGFCDKTGRDNKWQPWKCEEEKK